MTIQELQTALEALHSPSADLTTQQSQAVLTAFLDGLNNGSIRSASPTENGDWVVNTWVKRSILLLFRAGQMVDMSEGGFSFFDKHTIPTKPMQLSDGISKQLQTFSTKNSIILSYNFIGFIIFDKTTGQERFYYHK